MMSIAVIGALVVPATTAPMPTKAYAPGDAVVYGKSIWTI